MCGVRSRPRDARRPAPGPQTTKDPRRDLTRTIAGIAPDRRYRSWRLARRDGRQIRRDRQMTTSRLRPPGNALHEGINRDDRERGDTDEDGETVELQEHSEPDQRLHDEKDVGAADRELARRDRTRPRAFDPGVEIAVADIIPCATGA